MKIKNKDLKLILDNEIKSNENYNIIYNDIIDFFENNNGYNISVKSEIYNNTSLNKKLLNLKIM